MPGERRPQRLRDLTHRQAERARDAAIELELELRLLPLGRQSDVHRARNLLHLRLHHAPPPASSATTSCPRSWSWICFESAAEVAREHRDRRAGDVLHLVAQLLGELLDRLVALVLRHGADVDVALVHAARRAVAERRVRVRTSGCARAMRAASSALSRVYSRFEPGGVSSSMMNSARSSSGKNAVPTVRTGGTTFAAARRTRRSPTTADHRCAAPVQPALREREHHDRDADESPPPSPLTPRLGSTNDAKKVSAAIVTIAAR